MNNSLGKPPVENRSHWKPVEYFSNYKIKESDLMVLQLGIETVAGSGLLDDDVMDNIRFVTYDSQYFYVVTRGAHVSTDRFNVEELPTNNKSRFRTFKIAHSNFFGTTIQDYLKIYSGAAAWLLRDEIEETATNAIKFPNENVILQPGIVQPENILDVVRMSPLEPYDAIQQGRYNYLTDVIFHEAGHIEHRRLKNWQFGKEPTVLFPSEKQKEAFISKIVKTSSFPVWAVESIISKINYRSIGEMYTMLIDREAARLYDAAKFDKENAKFEQMLSELTGSSGNSDVARKFKQSLESGHVTGRLLVRILEEQFPIFSERKKFVKSVQDFSLR